MEVKRVDYSQKEWIQLTEDEVKENINHQINLGLDEYVIEWGDTLPTIAKVLNLTDEEFEDLLEFNEIEDSSLIMVGDSLEGILRPLF